jgi:hypothetical protein
MRPLSQRERCIVARRSTQVIKRPVFPNSASLERHKGTRRRRAHCDSPLLIARRTARAPYGTTLISDTSKGKNPLPKGTRRSASSYEAIMRYIAAVEYEHLGATTHDREEDEGLTRLAEWPDFLLRTTLFSVFARITKSRGQNPLGVTFAPEQTPARCCWLSVWETSTESC